MQQRCVFGVDIGDVIVANSVEKLEIGEPEFEEWFLSRGEVPGAIASVAELARSPFEGRVHVISKRRPETNELTLEWLRRRGFFTQVGIPESHVHFCRRREEKHPICQAHGVTHFVDNRLEVLSYLETVSYRFLLNAQEEEMDTFRHALPQVVRVANWNEIVRHITTHP